jgi:hypothetical protein
VSRAGTAFSFSWSCSASATPDLYVASVGN